jgi:hypothetical protein
MDTPKPRTERAIALTAISNKAQELAQEGKEGFEIQTFIAGARRELGKQRPDPEMYAAAAQVAKAAKNRR